MTAYNEYFTWKKEYALGSRDAACYICDALYNECAKPKFYKDIFKTFGTMMFVAKKTRGNFYNL